MKREREKQQRKEAIMMGQAQNKSKMKGRYQKNWNRNRYNERQVKYKRLEGCVYLLLSSSFISTPYLYSRGDSIYLFVSRLCFPNDKEW